MKDEVVRRPVQARREPTENLAKGLGRRRDVRVRRSPEVRLMASRDDPDLEGGARGEWREGDGGVILPDHPVGPARLVADEATPRALPFPDDEPGGTAQLLRDPVRNLGKVVEIEAQVIGPRAG